MMKKILFIFMICLLVGCGTKQKDAKSEEFIFMGFPGISEDGIYHMVDSSVNKEVYFYDIKEGKDIPLCGKVNCDHNNRDCDAYQLTMFEDARLSFAPMVYKEKLYYIYENTAEAKTIFVSSDMAGRNLEKIKELNDLSIITTAMLYDDKLWYSDNAFELDEQGEIIGTGAKFGLQYIDLNTKEIKRIKEKGDLQYVVRGAHDAKVYVVELDSNKTSFPLKSISSDNLELEETIHDFVDINSIVIENAFYGYDQETSQIYKINLSDLERENVMECELPMGYKLLSVAQTNPYGIMTLVLVNEQKQTAEMYIDVLEEKVLDGSEKIIYGNKNKYYVVDQKGIVKQQ